MLLVMNDFLDQDECQYLQKYLVGSLERGHSTPVADQHESFFHGRQIDLASCDDDKCFTIMTEAQVYAAQIASAVFRQEMAPDYTDLVLWREGMSMEPHVDCNEPFVHRLVSAVVNLSDAFEGGQSFLEGHEDITPKVGRLAMYMSLTEHGVRPITTGDRHTLAMWFKAR